MVRNTRSAVKPARRKRRRKNPPARTASRGTSVAGRWTITATKKPGGKRFYYAGGARLTEAVGDAIKFPSIIHAEKVKGQILSDFPAQLTRKYLWQAWPLS
jgi:hypothetical protein